MDTFEDKKPSRKKVDLPEGYLSVANTDLYHELRGALAEKSLWTPQETWPTTDLETSHHKGIAQIRPDPSLLLNDEEEVEWRVRVAKYVLKLNDLTADVLDVVCTLWLESSPQSFDSMITIKASDFLQFRGLKKRSGRGNGYKVEQKREVAEQLALLSNLWIQVKAFSKGNDRFFRSTAITKASEVGEEDKQGVQTIYAWRVKPGDVFLPFLLGPGRILAPLSKKALQFDPYRQKLEKRLTRYLTWIWRIRQNKGSYLQPFKVATLLDATKTSVDRKNPIKTQERLEKALDTLKEAKVISNWNYEAGTDFSLVGQRGWLEQWCLWRVEIEPPDLILDYYNHCMPPVRTEVSVPPIVPALSPTDQLVHPAVGEMRTRRKERRLTQLQLGEQLGVSGIYISKLERGAKSLSRRMEASIKKWLAQN